MDVTPYKLDDFGALLMLHLIQRSDLVNHLKPKDIPATGYIVKEGHQYVAIGFIRLIEGGYGMLDTLVTNADLPPETRHKGLSLLVDTLIHKAKDLKLNALISHTIDTGIINRAKSLGFKEIEQKIISLSL